MFHGHDHLDMNDRHWYLKCHKKCEIPLITGFKSSNDLSNKVKSLAIHKNKTGKKYEKPKDKKEGMWKVRCQH